MHQRGAMSAIKYKAAKHMPYIVTTHSGIRLFIDRFYWDTLDAFP